MAMAKQAEAETASQEANDLIQMIQLKEAQEAQAFQQMMAEKQFGLAQEKQALDEWYKRAQIGLAGSGGGTGGDGDVLDNLSVSEKNKIDDITTALTDLRNVKQKLEEHTSGGSWLQDIFTGVTGPLSDIGGSYRPGADVRAAIENLKADIQHEKYGSALTETEVKQGKKWLIDSSKQETTNLNNINELIQRQENRLKSMLRNRGIPENELDLFIRGITGGDIVQQQSVLPTTGNIGVGVSNDISRLADQFEY
jgi:hypothetical protein